MVTTKQKGQAKPTAISIAYKTVAELGITHSQLKKLDISVNYPTLRNIRDGKTLKKSTEKFYLKLFVDLINLEYEQRLHNGGNGATSLVIKLRDILLAGM